MYRIFFFFLKKNCTKILTHFLYPPDLAQAGFYQFPKVNDNIKRSRVSGNDVSQKAAKALSKEDFQGILPATKG